VIGVFKAAVFWGAILGILELLIGPATHGRSSLTKLQQLDGVDLLMRELGSGTRQATLDFLAQHDITPRIRMTLGSNEAI
jgi:LysR family transcriptional regulator, low CO2-responsive transcriptional regulator